MEPESKLVIGSPATVASGNRTVRVPDATVAGEPITRFDSASMGASAYRDLAKEVLERWRQAGRA